MALSLHERVQRLPVELQSFICNYFCAGLDDNDFSFRIFKQPDDVMCRGCLGHEVKPQGEYRQPKLHLCRFARRYQEYRLKRESKVETTHSFSWTIHDDEAMFKYFRHISPGHGIWVLDNARISLWIYIMTGHQVDRKKVSSHIQVLKGLSRPGTDCSHQCDPYRCRSCIVTQLHDRVHESAGWFKPEVSDYSLAPGVVNSLEELIAGFTHVINHIAPASGDPGHESGVPDQLTKKTVQQIQICTSKLIGNVARANITPFAGSEEFQQIQMCTSKVIDVVSQVTVRPSVKSEDDQRVQYCTSDLIEVVAQATIRRSAESEDLRNALSDRLTRLQELSKTLTTEQPSQKFDHTSCELSPPTVCQTVRTISPGLDQLLRVGDDPRNRIIIQRLGNAYPRSKNGRDHKDCNDFLTKQQGPWRSAKVDKKCGPYLWLQFEDVDALKVFTERTTKQTLKTITRIELEYDPTPGDLTVDAIVQLINTKFPTLRKFCTSVLPVRRLAAHPFVWGRHSSHMKEGNPEWWMDREIAYFMALENVTAHVCLSFRWKSDADWFAQKYPRSGKWRHPSRTEGDEEFGEWIFDRGF